MTHRFLSTTFLTGALCALPHLASAQVWDEAPEPDGPVNAVITFDWARKVTTDMVALEAVLDTAPPESSGTSNVKIDLPLPDGGVGSFMLMNSPIMETELAAQEFGIETYTVMDQDNPNNVGRLDMTSRGFHGMVKYNGNLIYIDPTDNKTAFHTYFESDYRALETNEEASETACSFDETAVSQNQQFTPIPLKNSSNFAQSQKISLGPNLRQYRMAVAATGEYTQFFGGTKEDGIAAVATAVNRLNVFFETDMAIRFQLVANNDDLIFTDPDTDGITNDDKLVAIGESTDIMNNAIGEDNYDIGQILGRGGGGVVASLNLPCTSRKAQGFSGQATPNNVAFMNTFAHEIGHMFGAPHSFNGSTGACGAGQRSTTTNVEPHSGATFMSYNGLCGAENLLGGRGAFFHNASLTAMNNFTEDPARGGSCATLVPISNVVPNIEAGPASTIPMSTPFTLTGAISNPGTDTLTHIWEQVDSGTPNASEDDFADEGTRAIFRSFLPNESLSRTFPQLERILAGDRVIGEVLPSTDRDITFRMTTRDGMGGVADDERIISVTTTAGPFTIATPASAALDGGVAHTVTWDVANTTAAPVSCPTVKLSLSTDGGQNFTTDLAASTPNDGTASVTLPNVSTTTARLKATCLNQPFFAINNANFAITPTVVVNRAPIAVSDTITVAEDSRRTAVSVLTNDNDPEGDTITLANVGVPSQGGTVTISGSTLIYTPVVGFFGTETVSYTVSDGNNNSGTAVVTFTVTEKPNAAPNAVDDTLTVEEDSAATLISVLSNDSDADNNALTLQSLGTPSEGAAITISGSQVSYTPLAGFSGEETFNYTINDGEGETATATVTVTVTPKPNAAPVIAEEMLRVTTDQDTNTILIDVLANVSDADGDALTITSIGTPSAGGTAVIQGTQIAYTPAAGYSGQETFTYTISDGEGGEQSGTVSVSVTAPPPPPLGVTPPASSSSGGGGSFGPFLLLLLALRNRITRRRETKV